MYNTTLATARAIVDHGGMRALWQGTQPTVIRLAFGAGVHFFILETVRPVVATLLPIQQKQQQHDNGNSRHMQLSAGAAALVGGLSRSLAAMVACPFTVVKTRMEYVAAHSSAATTGATVPGIATAPVAGTMAAAGGHGYRGTLHALSSITRAEGLRGLYRGLGPTVLSNAPFSGDREIRWGLRMGDSATAGGASSHSPGAIRPYVDAHMISSYPLHPL